MSDFVTVTAGAISLIRDAKYFNISADNMQVKLINQHNHEKATPTTS